MTTEYLVYVEWEDSNSKHSVWTHNEDLECLSRTRCRSVGWLVGEDKDVLCLAAHRSVDTKQWGGDMTIPKRSITKRRRVKLS